MPIRYTTSFVQLHHHAAGATRKTEWLGFVTSEQLRVRGGAAKNTLLRSVSWQTALRNTAR